MNPYESPKIAEPIASAGVLAETEPVVAQFDLTPDFILEILKRHRSLYKRRIVFALLKYLASLLFLGMAALAIVRGRSLGGIIMGGAGVFLLFSSQFDRWQTRRKLRASPYINEAVRLEFSDAGMHAVSPSQDTRLKWKVFTRMVEFDEGFLLMQGPNQCNWIPNHSILGEYGHARLGNLLTAKIPNCEDRRTKRSS